MKILENNPLPGNLIPYNISANGGWRVKTRIAFQSLRTITFVWALDGTGTGGTIFSWVDPVSGNGFILSVNGQQLTATWTIQGGATLQGTMPVSVNAQNTNYTRITFEAVGGVMLPNQIRIATVAMNLNDITNIENPTNQILLVTQGAGLFARYIQNQSMAGFMTFGASQGSAASGQGGVGLLIGFLHLFDYIVNAANSQVDVSGGWKRKFIY